MDTAQIGRLREVLQQAIDDCDEQIQQFEKYKADYDALQKRLETLPDKVSHDILVPFGSLAFMPGKMVHTNEILVLLGDDWFAERSSKQACEIVERRKANVDENLQKLHEEKKLLMSRAGYADTVRAEMASEDVVEIREEYDPEKEMKWKADRKKQIQRNNVEKKETVKNVESKQSSGVTESQKRNNMTEAELWARLDALEAEEDELDELAKMSDFDESEDGEEEEDIEKLPNEKKHVKWKDQQENENEDDTEEPNKTITFSFTKVPQSASIEEFVDKESTIPKESSTSEFPRIESPIDIYKHFGQSKIVEKGEQEGSLHEKTEASTVKPTSILKPAKETQSRNQEKESVPRNPVQIMPAPPSAFLGTVVERSKPTSSSLTEEQPKTAPPQRLSKFKASRQKMS